LRRRKHERTYEPLILALKTAGTWDWDLLSGKITWSPELFALLDLEQAEHEPSIASWERALHPDDRATARAELDQAARNGARLAIEYRIVRGDGEVRWISALGQATCDAARPIRMTGVCIDITEPKRSRESK